MREQAGGLRIDVSTIEDMRGRDGFARSELADAAMPMDLPAVAAAVSRWSTVLSGVHWWGGGPVTSV